MSEQKIEKKVTDDDMGDETHDVEESQTDDMGEKQTVRKEEVKENKGM